jgi:hypothetical protein
MLLQKNYVSIEKTKILFFKNYKIQISKKTIYNTLKDYKNLFQFSEIRNSKNIPLTLYKSKDVNFLINLNNQK